MAKTTVVTKKKRGPPPTGKGIQIGERWHPPEIAAIDAWIETQGENLTRGHAVRRLVALGLKAKTKTRPTGRNRAARASDLAAEVIDSLTVGVADSEQQAGRRRRLLKGPEEFRETRVDRPKAKK